MNGINILIDTNIALYLLNGEAKIASLLDGKTLYLSEISEMELLSFSNLSPEDESIINDK